MYREPCLPRLNKDWEGDPVIQFMSPEPGVKHQEVTTQGELMTGIEGDYILQRLERKASMDHIGMTEQQQDAYNVRSLKIALHRLRAMGVIINESEAYLDNQGNVKVKGE